jgi:diguanylate cyclase (GGDEF)-like protein
MWSNPIFDEKWVYRIIVILSLCILLTWTYLTNEDTLLNYVGGRFILDTRLIWQLGIFSLLSVVLFYLMQSTIDYKVQNEILKKYLQRLQQELDIEREAIKELKTESNEELLRLESFIITMSDTARQISSVLHTDELLRVILRKAVDLLGAHRCAIFKVNAETKDLFCIDSTGYKKEEIEGLSFKADEKSGLIGYAADQGIFISRKTLMQDYTKKHIIDQDKLGSIFCQPIVHNLRTLAVICIGSISADLTHEQTMRLLSTLANFGAVALTNTELVDRIREQSIRDSLTWLYNHQYFQSRLNDILIVAKREKESFGFIIMDIDYFKKFNDKYGHQAGDFVLKKSAEILNSELRGSDIVARYGGEEFVAILPKRDLKGAYSIAERIRSVFEKASFKYEHHDLKITISAGVSAYVPSADTGLTKELIIRYADDALYKAKEEGRNRVVIHKT